MSLRSSAVQCCKVVSPALALLMSLAAIASPAKAQDTFEIQVYEWETVPRGRWNLETHVNHTARGTKTFEGKLAPTDGQNHLTFELTRGISDYFELAGYLVLANRDAEGAQFAGYRIRPRVRFPETWGLPFLFSLSLEVGFPRPAYEENSTTLEIRPILEKAFGRTKIDVNPVLARALKGPGTADGLEFEPGVRLAYATKPSLDLSMEYYGATGDIANMVPIRHQVHMLFPGFDWQINSDVVMNFGYGIPLTRPSDGIIKARLGVLFGGTPK